MRIIKKSLVREKQGARWVGTSTDGMFRGSSVPCSGKDGC